jgi:hypothetical protein
VTQLDERGDGAAADVAHLLASAQSLAVLASAGTCCIGCFSVIRKLVLATHCVTFRHQPTVARMTTAAAAANVLIDAAWCGETVVRRRCAASAQGYPGDGSACATIMRRVPTCCCETATISWVCLSSAPPTWATCGRPMNWRRSVQESWGRCLASAARMSLSSGLSFAMYGAY